MNNYLKDYETILYKRIFNQILLQIAVPILIFVIICSVYINITLRNQGKTIAKLIDNNNTLYYKYNLAETKIIYITQKLSLMESGMYRHPKTWQETIKALQEFDVNFIDMLNSVKE